MNYSTKIVIIKLKVILQITFANILLLWRLGLCSVSFLVLIIICNLKDDVYNQMQVSESAYRKIIDVREHHFGG